MSTDDLVFATDRVPPPPVESGVPAQRSPWKLMIIDDDTDVHTLTRLVLRQFVFEGRALEFVSGYSQADAHQLMALHPDTAVLLLDVVMETDHAGLEAVRYIRDTLKNRFVRIILRTGQPGYAPEERVIMEYDINDYKEKTDLTDIRLGAAVVTSLRAYRDMMIIEKNRQGLKKIIHATGSLFEPRSIKTLATGVLDQLVAILGLDESALYAQTAGFAVCEGDMILYAGTGRFGEYEGHFLTDVVDDSVMAPIRLAMEAKQTIFQDNIFVGYFQSRQGSVNLLYLKGIGRLEEWDRELILLYAANVGLAFDHVLLHRELFSSQEELTFALGEIIEERANESGFHVQRVAAMSRLLGVKVGLSEADLEQLWLAAPLHDLGKVGLPETVVCKPSLLQDVEWDLVKEHPILGAQMLKGSNRKILQLAGVIAVQHHERWDGAGYPQGLSGEGIHLFARIVSLVEVFDALAFERVHKRAWPLERTVAFIRNARGKRFDPHLVDLFLENLDEFLLLVEKLTARAAENGA